MKSLSMTEGKVAPLLIRFAIPLMLGDLFQQLYIAMDTAIVGRFAGDTALAAVSSSTFLIRMLIGLFVGVSAGASVVISHCVGAAAATVIAQMISAICVLYAMIHTTQPYKLVVSKMRIHKEYVGEILQMGLPAGMQSVIVSLSNVLVQYRINMLGTAVIAGFGLFNKFDGVIMLPGSAFALATMMFVGQNFGAKKYERIKEGLKAMCVMRQIWLFIEDALGMGVEGILFSYPFSWLLTLAVTGLYILYLENSNKVRMKVQMEG